MNCKSRMIKVKYLYDFFVGFTPDTNNQSFYSANNNGYKWANVSDLNSYEIFDTNNKLTKVAVLGKNISPKGSLLYSFKLSVGKVSFCKDAMYTNEAIATFLPNDKNNLRFLYYAAPHFIVLNANENIYGAKILNQDRIKNAKIPNFTLDKQTKIANYLDIKVAAIDKAISNSEEEINKLNEYKIRLIRKTVFSTDKRRVKFISNLITGGTPNTNIDNYWINGDIIWITPADIEKDSVFISSGERNITKKGYNNSSVNFIDNNALIITTRAPIGKIVINTKKCCINQGCKALTFNKNYLNKYYYYYFYSHKVELESLGKGTTFLELSSSDLINIKVPIVSLQDQEEIVNYLDKKCEVINKLIEVKNKKIEILKEYKKSLIYECVTGRRDIPC